MRVQRRRSACIGQPARDQVFHMRQNRERGSLLQPIVKPDIDALDQPGDRVFMRSKRIED